MRKKAEGEFDWSVISKAQLYSVKRRRRRQLKREEEEEREVNKKGVKEKEKKV